MFQLFSKRLALSLLFCVALLASAFAGRDPEIATDDNGNWMTVWREQSSLQSSFSSDNGATWTNPKVIDTPSENLHRFHIVYAGNGIWIAVWRTSGASGGRVYASRSTSGGIWSKAAILPSSEPVSDMDSDGAGTIIFTNGLYLVRSDDYGNSWNVVAFPVLKAGDTLQNGFVSTAGNGKWVSVSIGNEFPPGSIIHTSRFIRVFISNDNGVTWAGPTEFNHTGLRVVGVGGYQDTLAMVLNKFLPDAVYPFDYGDPGYIHVISSTDGGTTWSDAIPVTPADSRQSIERDFTTVDVSSNGKWLVAYGKSVEIMGGSDVRYDIRVISSDSPATGWTDFQTAVVGPDEIFDARRPSVAIDSNGNAVIVYELVDIYWDYETQKYLSTEILMYVRSSDSGNTWTSPAEMQATLVPTSAADWQLFD